MSHKGAPFVADADVPWTEVGGGIRRKVLCYNDGIMLVRVEFEAGSVGAAHRHPHVQCSVVESGVFDVTIGDMTRRLQAGDSYLVPGDVQHGAIAIEAGVLVDVFTPKRDDLA